MLKIYNEQELETLEKGGKEAKKLKLSKEESRLISGMYTTKGKKIISFQDSSFFITFLLKRL